MRINEENFIRELTKKNHKALEYVINIYSPIVNGVIRKVLNPLKNEGLIEECISDVFISVWNNTEKFKGESDKFKSWIGSISRYKAIDYYRKHKVINYEVEVIEENIASDIDLEEDIMKEIEKSTVIGLVNNLKEPDRSIFIMKFFFGYTSKKISEVLGITVSTIDTKVNRGRKKLKNQYDTTNKEGAYE